MKKVIIAVAALVVGVAAGWFAGGAGRARCPQRADCGGLGQAPSPAARAVAAKPKRKAPIRSSGDVEVQRRILQANIAALEKRFAVVKREAAAIAEAKAALKASGEKSVWDLLLQREEALRKLKAEGRKETVGEMRRLAPDWFEDACKLPVGKSDMLRRRTVEMLEILSAIDVSGRTDEERKVHALYMEKLANMSLNMDAKLDAVTDDTPCDELWGIVGDSLNQASMELFGKTKIRDRECKMLRNLISQNSGISEEEIAAMIRETSREVGTALYESLPSVGRIGDRKGGK